METYATIWISAAMVSVILTVNFSREGCSMCCEAADALPPSRLGYYELRRFILNHNIVEGKIPPKIIPIRNKNFTDAIKVDLALYPVEIMSLDATEQVMSVTSYLVVMWEDPQLTWNPEDHDNVEMVELKASDIWLPTLSIVNMVGKKEILQDHKDGSVNLYSDGHVILSTSVQLMTACKMDLMYFPFDEQDCDIIFYTLSETPVAIHQLDVPLETSLQQYGAGGEWTLTNVKWTPLYDIFNVRYTSSVRGQFTLTLKRKTTFYTATIIGPMILFTVMNCLVFIIPLESGEKISFLISIFISNTVFSSYVNGIMPRGLGAKVPLLMVYVLGMWMMSLANFLATVVVMRKFHREQKVDARQDEHQEGGTENKSPALSGILGSMRCEKCQRNRVSDSAASIFDQNQQASSDDRAASVKPEQHQDQLDEIKLPGGTKVAKRDKRGGHNLSFSLQANESNQRATTSCLTAKQLDHIFLVISLMIVTAAIVGLCTVMVKGQ